MKKVISFIIAFSMICALILAPIKVRAEEVEQPESEQVEEQEQELTFDEFKEKAQDWITQYTGESIAIKIIGWLIDAGVLGALFVVVVKYSKYKHTTIDDLLKSFKEQIGENLKENFDGLSVKEIAKITGKINELETSIETIMKVLILAQDGTPKGKATLLEYLGTKTHSQEIKQAIEDEKVVIQEQVSANEKALGKVSDDYKDIF